MFIGFNLFNYIYVFFQSLSQTNFENHIALYDNITIFKKCDFLTIYYDVNFIIRSSFFGYNVLDILNVLNVLTVLIVLIIVLKYFRLQNRICSKRKKDNKLTVENKIELIEENINVIKNLLIVLNDKVKTFDDCKLNDTVEEEDTVEDTVEEDTVEDTVEEDDDVEEEDEDYIDEEYQDDDDEDIYEKYDKLLSENNKLNDKIKKISEYTNMEFCRSAKIVSYIKEEIKRK